jgi:prevent-host-death family protein
VKKEVNTHEAKTHLSRLLQRVAAGEEITIASRGNPVARLIPIRPKESSRLLECSGESWRFPRISTRRYQMNCLTRLMGEGSESGKDPEIAARHQRNSLERHGGV